MLDDPMMFVAPAAAPEAGQRMVSITEIATLPMIGTRTAGCRQIIDDVFRHAPVSPTYIFRSDDTPTIQGLIGSGLAYAVLPLLTVDEHDPNVAVIPIRPEPPPRRLGIAWHPRAHAATSPPPLRRSRGRDLSRPRRTVGGIARRLNTACDQAGAPEVPQNARHPAAGSVADVPKGVTLPAVGGTRPPGGLDTSSEA